jgi:tetratricopeptide (TPR) repeat protein
VVRIFWAISDKSNSQVKFAPESPVTPPTRAVARTGEVSQAQAPLTAPPASPAPTADINTEALRRAVFLSKHGESLERSGQVEEAIKRYREALDIWPYLTSVWNQLGRVYLRQRDYPRAQIALEKAVENNPGQAELLNDLGVAYLYQGKTKRARDVLEAAMEVDPGYAPSVFNLALCHIHSNEAGPARDQLVRYLRLQPNDARALRELAFLDALDKRYQDAMDGLEKALANAAEWPLLYFDAAAVSALMGRPDQAVNYLEKVEPLTDPASVYRLYQEPAFREIRLTELGKLFELELAKRARERATETTPAPPAPVTSEPISSATATNRPAAR